MVDRTLQPEGLRETVYASVLGGVDRIQLRDRTLEGAEWLAFAESLAETARRAQSDVEIIVNRRIDVALAIGADGVHLGFDAMPLEQARGLLGPEATIGTSTHDAREALQATRSGADYVHLAPIFAPLSKRATRPPLGLDALSNACRDGTGIIAQGGIQAENVASILEAGASGIAVTGAILQSSDPRRAAARLRTALDSTSRSE